MANIFIIHGTHGHPENNWFPWLKEKLQAAGHSVWVPHFPTPEQQSLQNWEKAFAPYEKYLDEKSIVIGHSLGVAFLLHLLEKHKVSAAFFVSGFDEFLGNDFDELNKTFIRSERNWRKIRENCGKFFIYHSNNDPYVPLEKAENIARNLQTEVRVIPNAGHFNESAGYIKFEELYGKLLQFLDS